MRPSGKSCAALIVAAAALAAVFRVPGLGMRPMHGDEAVGAVKFGRLLDDGYYRYDPHQYHGPTLNYFSLIPAYLTSAACFSEVTEVTLRSVPVFFGAALVVMLFLVAGGIGPAAAVCAALFCAVSPAMVFYSRFYVHEMLLVFFTFGVIACGWRYVNSGRFPWAIAAGVFAGLSLATKETGFIALGGMVLALGGVRAIRDPASVCRRYRWKTFALHISAAAVVAAAVAALFFSSFFSHPEGVVDSVKFLGSYSERAAGGDALHLHPWYYYLHMLAFWHLGHGMVFSEGLILLLAGIGFLAAIAGRLEGRADRNLVRFIAFYTAILTIAYSAIPYKTPWCMLGFLHGMTILAAIGAASLLRRFTGTSFKAIAAAFLIIAFCHLAYQAYMANYRYYDDPVNPYVYAHTSRDIYGMVEKIDEAASCADGRETYMEVICPGDDYWPLPWYLRKYDRVAWYSQVDPASPAGTVIIASPQVQPALVEKLYRLPPPGRRDLYVPLFDGYMELRPQVELLGFVKAETWQRMPQDNLPPLQK